MLHELRSPDPATVSFEDLRTAYDALFLEFELPEITWFEESHFGGIPVRLAVRQCAPLLL